MTRLPRILYAVPPLPRVRLEITKVISALAAADDKRFEPTDLVKTQNEHDLIAEIVRDAWKLLAKTGYNPNEPRVPAGNPDGGQWTKEEGGSARNVPYAAATLPSAAGIDHQYAANSASGIGHNQGPPLEEPPEIPSRVLATRQAINDFLKAAAYWLEEASGVHKRAAALFFIALMATGWLAHKYLPYIITYQDPPRSLQELQQAALLPKIEYYNDHHLVEQTAAEDDGFSRSMIDASANIVRIPTLKHWLITGWYQVPNPNFDWLSPREYLRGKSWEERVRVGKDALIEFGVLQP